MSGPRDGPRCAGVLCTHPGGLHRIAYREWLPARVDARTRTVLCVHGLTRRGTDFDVLAARLAGEGLRVVCPDMAGRGDSDPLPEGRMYRVDQYVADCVTLVARLGVERVDWIGTSMGGIVGMALASLPGHPIERLLMNDVGPRIDPRGLERIRGYARGEGEWDSFASAEAALRDTMGSFGPHSPEQFRKLSAHHFVEGEDGRWRTHHDPRIADVLFAGDGPPPEMWSLWEAVDCPVTVLRGAESDLLARDTWEAMLARGPDVDGCEFEGVGHAPTLMDDDQVEAVRRFLGIA